MFKSCLLVFKFNGSMYERRVRMSTEADPEAIFRGLGLRRGQFLCVFEVLLRSIFENQVISRWQRRSLFNKKCGELQSEYNGLR